MPLAATAGESKGRYQPDRRVDRLELGSYLQALAGKSKQSNGLDGQNVLTAEGTHVDRGLLKTADEHPNQIVRVIIQSQGGLDSAGDAGRGLGTVTNKLGLIGAVSMELSASRSTSWP